jgi:hypothetical protein
MRWRLTTRKIIRGAPVVPDSDNNEPSPVDPRFPEVKDPIYNQETREVSAAVEDLQKFQKSHQWDPNLPQSKIDAINEATRCMDAEKAVDVDRSIEEDSPYEEVRAAVRNTDGGEVANTVRAWILGMIFVTVGSGLNMFLSMRLKISRSAYI